MIPLSPWTTLDVRGQILSFKKVENFCQYIPLPLKSHEKDF